MPARSRCKKICMRADPSRDEYQQDAARTRYNRGILRFGTANTPGSAEFRATESDFRQAILLLEPLAGRPSDPVPSLELARAYNNLANLLALDDTQLAEARRFYEAAIGRDEELVKAEPANRVYKMELAMFCNNLSFLLELLGENDLAKARSRQALSLLDELALPAPSLSIEQADAHNVRGRLLQAAGCARSACRVPPGACHLREPVAGPYCTRRDPGSRALPGLSAKLGALQQGQP